MEKLWITIFSMVLLFGCGGGSGSGSGNKEVTSKVTYADRAGIGTVANYTNADWLYKNYLGEYGLPEETKPQFMPAIKMLANGFDLQLKRGEDVKANIEHFHQQMMSFLANGEAARFVKSMYETPAQVEYSDGNLLPNGKTLTQSDQVEAIADYVPLPMSDDTKQAVAEALAEDERVREYVKKTAAYYNLPYNIDGQDAQWFIYTPTMKGSKGGGSTPPPPKTHHITSWNWRMGDIIWSNGRVGTEIPGHVGIVDSNHPTAWAVEANTVGVVVFRDLDTWANRYTAIRAYTPKLYWDARLSRDPSLPDVPPGYAQFMNYGYATDRWWAVHYAHLQVGKQYNYYWWNPYDTDTFYCSSLVWRAYERIGWNILDYDLDRYRVIYTQDVTNSTKTTLFNSSSL